MTSAKDLSCPGQGPHNKVLETALTRVPDLVREPWTQGATIQSHTTQLMVSRLFRGERCLIPLQDVPQSPLGREARHPVYLLGWFLWCQTLAVTVICITCGERSGDENGRFLCSHMDEEILPLASVPRYHLRLGLRATTLDPDMPGPIAACFPALPSAYPGSHAPSPVPS